MALGKVKSNRPIPADVAITKIHATPESSIPKQGQGPMAEARGKEPKPESVANGSMIQAQNDISKNKKDDKTQDLEVADITATPKPDQLSGPPQDTSNTKSTWLGWFSASDTGRGPSTGTEDGPKPAEVQRQLEAITETQKADTEDQPPKMDNKEDIKTTGSKRGWFPIWISETNDKPPPTSRLPVPSDPENDSATTKSLLAPEAAQMASSHSKASSIETSPPPALPGDASKSAGWVFWSRDRKVNSSTLSDELPHVGEIAISDTPSQKLPQRASIQLPDSKDKTVELKVKADAQERPQSPAPSVKDPNRGKTTKDRATLSTPPSTDTKTVEAKSTATTTKVETSKVAAVVKAPEEGQPNTTAAPPAKKYPPNLLLPPFKETFVLQDNPSILQQIGRLLAYSKTPEPKHLSLVRDPPHIKNVLVIGVHGYFPAPLIRTVLGQPTGTSIKFADMAAKSIRKWTESRGYECEVKTAALEGEGKIAERIELLWTLLLNWIDEIRKADFVMVACHSQGVPVAIMLIAKLIQFGCVNSARIGVCAMAGVNMGPFQDYKSRWISGSAGELFEFSDPASKVSTNYLSALETALKFGVRVSFIGSIDDQLVSLESSLYTPISHPHIYRAVQIDSRVHAPNFLSHLVGFALKLRNLGVPDHGLIRELSWPLAGSLYTSEGHSRIYEDDAVYDLAVAFALETNSLNHVNLTQRPSMVGASNPYVLPFAMRGILEEDLVKTELQSEAVQLLKQFDEWKPNTKVLKDVKFRLEGIRSKL
jgi:hypothetical protein